jgi:thermitase
MRKTIAALAVVILLISSFPTIVFAAPPDNQSPGSAFSSQQILVKFKPGTSQPGVAEIHGRLGGQVKETITDIGVQVVTVPKGQAKEKVKAYSSNPRVMYAEPDFVAEALGSPDDPRFVYQWGMVKIQAPQAWDVATGSSNISIAILDTGVDLDHPDLADKIVSNINFSDSPTVGDVYGHGTHVAGIAAAMTNNGIGVAGLGYASTIMNVKVLGDTGSGFYSWIASGIIWAADNGADVISMSLGGSSASSILEDAINYAWSKGVVVVASAGNSGSTTPSYPAYYANCIATAATDANDAKASWSNYGGWVDVAAPGVNIYSTFKDGSYVYESGTSMACPHVAGLAALVFTTVSDTNGDGKLNDEVRSRIEATCDDIGVSGIGYGRINAARAVGDVAPVLPGTISGQVTDAEDGLPIVGSTVSDGTRTTTTDASGGYTIGNVPPGSYQVTASKGGYESSSLMVTVLEGSTAAANLCLTQIIVPGSITGSITDTEDGSAISGAEVSDGSRIALTDGAGSYTIDSVPPGSYQVVASKAGYESSSLTVTVLEGNTAAANLCLTRIIVPGSITGSVTDAKDGSAISGAEVSDGSRIALTDALGTYTIGNVPAGSYPVVASKEGYETTSLTVDVLSEATAVANFYLSEIIVPGSITGWVTSAKDGSAVAGATVTDGTRTTTTDATGKYTIANVPAATYQVTASKLGYYSSSLTVTALSGSTAVANFYLSEIIVPGSITGSVTSAKDGSAVAGATVTDGTRTTTTDATGTYTIPNVPPGTYGVMATKLGYHSSSLTVTLLSGSTAVANFYLSDIIVPGSITGSITDAKNGSAIPGAQVSDGSRTALTDALGTYTINNVPPGSYQVVASKAGYESVTSSATVVSGGTALVNFSLNQKPPATNVMWVDNIRFIKNRNDLFIEVKVVTASGVLRKAKVGLRLECSNGKVLSFSGTTGTTGLVKFKVRNALVGGYVATVTSLTRSGFTWDMSRGITSASYYALGR